ncbi:MAG: twin-arginine translocase subunit TatC [Acidobacteria bacterium]|nr:twin-arginine translocase subunit TatC [Acidobacteriota bacterium]
MPTPEEQKEARASSTESSSTPQSGAGEPVEEPAASSLSSGEAAEPAGGATAESAEQATVPADSPPEDGHPDDGATAESAEQATVPAGSPPEGGYSDDGYGSEYGYGESSPASESPAAKKPASAVAPTGGDSGPPSTPSSPAKTDGDDEEDGMLRMSFLEHLEELRSRILKAVGGLLVAFVLCLIFANELWVAVSKPAIDALKRIGADPNLAQITPMDAFTTIWVKVPMLAAIFVASPWLLYQVWAFIAPGLYKKERRWATPFILCSAGLFIAGGLFAYFVAFRFGLEFLLSIGRNINVKPVVSIVEYFDLFVNVMLGIGLVFEMPILVFFLTLLRITTPGFLMRNSRYAVLIIVVLAAIITPTPDVFNLMLFSVPMCVLYFVGVFASYLLVLHREDQPFPWKAFLLTIAVILLIAAGALYIAVTRYNYRPVPYWPFLVR